MTSSREPTRASGLSLSFQTRLTLTLLAAAIVPLGVFGLVLIASGTVDPQVQGLQRAVGGIYPRSASTMPAGPFSDWNRWKRTGTAMDREVVCIAKAASGTTTGSLKGR